MFEKASKLKLRFPESRMGNISADDLWDMPLKSSNKESLNDLAKRLNRSLKESEEEDFVSEKTTANSIEELKFDIVKHVIEVKLIEEENAKNAVLRKAKKAKILDILADKEDNSLRRTSKANLEKMLEDL